MHEVDEERKRNMTKRNLRLPDTAAKAEVRAPSVPRSSNNPTGGVARSKTMDAKPICKRKQAQALGRNRASF